MPDQVPQIISALREPLRRMDAVLNFARKLAREDGGVPPGLMADFTEARRELEKAFVLNFEGLDENLQKQLRELLSVTKALSPEQFSQHVDKLSKRARSALNQLMIHGEGPLTLTDEIGRVRFSDEEPATLPEPEIPAAAYAVLTGPQPAPAPRPVRLRRALMAVVLIGVLGAVALMLAFLVGPWSGTAPAFNDSIAGDNRPPHGNGATAGNTPEQPDKPFDAEAAGYPARLTLAPLEQTVNPLEADPANLTPGELARLMLGLELLVQQLEPQRLAFPPDQTAARLRRFGEGVIAAEPAWREQRKQLLDAYIEHTRRELQLALYPAETSGEKVLVSDVLYSAGGGQSSLVITLQVLSQSCGVPTQLVAPLGPARPLLGHAARDGMHTFNGESFGLRDGRQPVLLLSEVLVELSGRLRPTMETPEGRCLCSAILERHAGALTVEQAREVLRDLDPAWLRVPAVDAEPRARMMYDLAKRLQPVVCEALLGADAGGDADEALAVYRLADAGGDVERANRALLVLGQRAKPGALLDGQPLPLVVGDLLLSQGKATEADAWFVRAMQEQLEDPRPVLRLLPRKQGETRFDLCREAYTRGERSLAFMRLFAETAAKQGDDLLALKLLDELCAGSEFDALDIRNAALLCMALGRTDWALTRLEKHRDITDSEPALQRLELICELSLNGLSERARKLAAEWRARGEKDEFVEGLLKRYGE
jgi:hypothetical protein